MWCKILRKQGLHMKYMHVFGYDNIIQEVGSACNLNSNNRVHGPRGTNFEDAYLLSGKLFKVIYSH